MAGPERGAVDEDAGLGQLHAVLLAGIAEALLWRLLALLQRCPAIVFNAGGRELLAMLILILAMASFGRLLALFEWLRAINLNFLLRAGTAEETAF